MNTSTYRAAFAAVVFCLVAASAHADPATTKKTSPVPAKSSKAAQAARTKSATKSAAPVWQCPDCKDTFTDAQAKKGGMKCSCCQTKLVRIKPAATKKGG